MSNTSDEPRASDMQEGARWALLRLMTAISEDLWCAGWLTGLEFTLWEAAQGNHKLTGLAENEARFLKRLSDEAGGWWIWDDESGEPRFVDLAIWRARVEARAAQRDDSGEQN